MKRAIVLALSAALIFSSAYAEDTSTAAQEWHGYVEPMMPIGERMAAKMQDPQDPLLRQELYRMLFMGLSSGYMAVYQADPEHPSFWPIWNTASNWFAPNPDDAYYATHIAGDGVYKISGYRGTVRIADFNIGSGELIPYGRDKLGPVLADYDLDKLHIGKDGSFEVILSAERPAGYKGDWWKLDPRATYITVRQIAYDWLHEVDGRFTIDRLDRPASAHRQNADEIDAMLKQIPSFAENWTKLSLQWIENVRAKGMVNKVFVHDLNDVGGYSKQKYIEGLWEMGPDEAVIWETEVPKKCRYWNVEITDMLWSAIDYANRQSSLNGFTAKLDKDGKFRAVISATDPGVPNWLDSAGYAKGEFFGRWTDCSSTPTPIITKVKLAELRKYLPADTPVVTPEARDAAIRLRRKGAQLRRRW